MGPKGWNKKLVLRPMESMEEYLGQTRCLCMRSYRQAHPGLLRRDKRSDLMCGWQSAEQTKLRVGARNLDRGQDLGGLVSHGKSLRLYCEIIENCQQISNWAMTSDLIFTRIPDYNRKVNVS